MRSKLFVKQFFLSHSAQPNPLFINETHVFTVITPEQRARSESRKKRRSFCNKIVFCLLQGHRFRSNYSSSSRSAQVWNCDLHMCFKSFSFCQSCFGCIHWNIDFFSGAPKTLFFFMHILVFWWLCVCDTNQQTWRVQCSGGAAWPGISSTTCTKNDDASSHASIIIFGVCNQQNLAVLAENAFQVIAARGIY